MAEYFTLCLKSDAETVKGTLKNDTPPHVIVGELPAGGTESGEVFLQYFDNTVPGITFAGGLPGHEGKIIIHSRK